MSSPFVDEIPVLSDWSGALDWAIANGAYGVTISSQVISWTMPGRFFQVRPLFNHIEGYVSQLLGMEQDALKRPDAYAETGFNYAGRRCRASLARTSLGLELVVRILPEKILSAAQIHLPEQVTANFCHERNGLYLVAGAKGVGKSTTMSYLVDSRMRTSPQRAVTLEDPIEFVFPVYESSHVSQQDVGVGCSVPSYAEGMKRSLRRDGSLIVVQEIRDYPTLDTALSASVSGHVVLASIHAGSCQEVIQRMIAIYESEGRQADGDLIATGLRCVIAQRMEYVARQPRPIHEILHVTSPVQAVLRKRSDFGRITDIISMGSRDGMQTFEASSKTYGVALRK